LPGTHPKSSSWSNHRATANEDAYHPSSIARQRPAGHAEVRSVASYRDGAEGLVSSDGHTVLIPVTLTGDKADAADTAAPLITLVDEANGQGAFRVTTVGFGSVEGEMSALLEETLQQGELIGIAVALVILLVVFGAAVAAGLPIILALLSIFVAAGATALVSNVMEIRTSSSYHHDDDLRSHRLIALHRPSLPRGARPRPQKRRNRPAGDRQPHRPVSGMRSPSRWRHV